MDVLQSIVDVINSITLLVIILLICVQMLALLIATPDKAEQINYLGKILEFLIKIRFGNGGYNDRKDFKN